MGASLSSSPPCVEEDSLLFQLQDTPCDKWVERCHEFKSSHANLKTTQTASLIESARVLLDVDACDEILIRFGERSTNINEFFFSFMLFSAGDMYFKLRKIFEVIDVSNRGWVSTHALRMNVALATCGLDRLTYISRPPLNVLNDIIGLEDDGYWTAETFTEALLGNEKSSAYLELIRNPLMLENVLEDLDSIWEEYILEIHDDRKQRSTIEWHATALEIADPSRPNAVEIGLDFELQYVDAANILWKVCPWLPSEILPEILDRVCKRCEKKGVDFYKGGVANLKMKPTQHSFLRSIRSDDLNLIVAASLAFAALTSDPMREVIDSRHYFTLQSILLELSPSFRGLDIGFHLPELAKCVSVDCYRFVTAVSIYTLTQERVQFYTKTIQSFQRHERNEVLKRNTCELALRQWVEANFNPGGQTQKEMLDEVVHTIVTEELWEELERQSSGAVDFEVFQRAVAFFHQQEKSLVLAMKHPHTFYDAMETLMGEAAAWKRRCKKAEKPS